MVMGPGTGSQQARRAITSQEVDYSPQKAERTTVECAGIQSTVWFEQTVEIEQVEDGPTGGARVAGSSRPGRAVGAWVSP